MCKNAENSFTTCNLMKPRGGLRQPAVVNTSIYKNKEEKPETYYCVSISLHLWFSEKEVMKFS